MGMNYQFKTYCNSEKNRLILQHGSYIICIKLILLFIFNCSY